MGLPSDEPLSESNHAAVAALTGILADRLSAVVAEYADWQTRRDFESAAAVHLIGKPDTDAVIYSELATPVSGRAMLEALISGQRDPGALAGLAQKRMPVKIPALTEALDQQPRNSRSLDPWGNEGIV